MHTFDTIFFNAILLVVLASWYVLLNVLFKSRAALLVKSAQETKRLKFWVLASGLFLPLGTFWIAFGVSMRGGSLLYNFAALAWYLSLAAPFLGIFMFVKLRKGKGL